LGIKIIDETSSHPVGVCEKCGHSGPVDADGRHPNCDYAALPIPQVETERPGDVLHRPDNKFTHRASNHPLLVKAAKRRIAEQREADIAAALRSRGKLQPSANDRHAVKMVAREMQAERMWLRMQRRQAEHVKRDTQQAKAELHKTKYPMQGQPLSHLAAVV